MGRPAFYDSPEYKAKQSAITKRNQDLGLYEFNKKQEERTCIRKGCTLTFIAHPSDLKRYCSQSCAGKINNAGRTMLASTKAKIALALTGKPSPFKGIRKVPLKTGVCERCNVSFVHKYYRTQRFCSTACAASRPTSPRASRGKAGVRPDISSTIYFYSRWEANIARLYTYLGIMWEFSPKSFDIGGHTYTPDFYLPETDTYIEVKNFWGEYSRIRDEKFRKTYPNLALKVILRDEYLKLEEEYAKLIPEWEYKNSPFELVT